MDLTIAEHGLYTPNCDMTRSGAAASDEDDIERRLAHTDVALISSFNRASIECSYGLVEATRAHEDSDPELFLVSAMHALNAWIEAAAAYMGLAEALGDAPLLRATKLCLDQRSEDLDVLLTAAENKFARAVVLARIKLMRESLKLARG